jgi:mannose-1-phosphate guanylyltransferase
MKAFILAAGKGERLRPLTDTIPKCLLSIQGVPILGIWLELCRRHGIDEVLVNTHSHADSVKDYLQHHRRDARLHVAEEESLLGSAGTVLTHRLWVGSERDFWIFYADVLTNTNLTDMLEFHRRQKQVATLGVNRVANPHQCGIVTVDREGVVQQFVEKPTNPSSDLAFSGILLATPAIFDVIPAHIPADIGFDVLPNLVGRMAAYPISDYLVDIGTSASYQYAQETWPGLAVLAS